MVTTNQVSINTSLKERRLSWPPGGYAARRPHNCIRLMKLPLAAAADHLQPLFFLALCCSPVFGLRKVLGDSRGF